MGDIHHNTVIATTWSDSEVERIKTWVSEIEDEFWAGLFVWGTSVINGFTSVVLMPDGSKEGWPESITGDKLRDSFIDTLKMSDYSDGSSPWSYVEVGYGDYGQKVTIGNCINRVIDEEYAG